ncbi:hypothetical protein AB0I81_48950 [Nonomuraea sp. NPDC050404]|uniref:hypothetical protein n=1 Tax=Nonomuraea sp. NPDC050404 TaxID=3155783 RepID=UPI0033F3ECFF
MTEPLAAAVTLAGRLRDLLHHRDPAVRVEAAHALYRLTGDPTTARWTLWAEVPGGAPVRWTALRYLAAMEGSNQGRLWQCREILDDDRLHHITPPWAGARSPRTANCGLAS